MVPGYSIILVVCVSIVVLQIVVLQVIMENVDNKHDASRFWNTMEQRDNRRRDLSHDSNDGAIDFSIMEILSKARVNLENVTLDEIPSEHDVVSLYGPKPVIIGLDRCEDFQALVPPLSRMIGTAGIFNTVSYFNCIYIYIYIYI